MSPGEKIDALSRRSGSVWSDFKVPCVQDYVAAVNGGLPLSEAVPRCTQLILYHEAGRDYSLSFIEDYPEHPGETVLISFSITLTHSVASNYSLTREVLTRFGPPTQTDNKHGRLMWCATPCRVSDWNTVGSGFSLLLEPGNQLLMGDNAYSQRRYTAIQAFLKSHKFDVGR